MLFNKYMSMELFGKEECSISMQLLIELKEIQIRKNHSRIEKSFRDIKRRNKE